MKMKEINYIESVFLHFHQHFQSFVVIKFWKFQCGQFASDCIKQLLYLKYFRMKTRRQDKKHIQSHSNLSLQTSYQNEVKLENQDSALANFLRRRSTFKNTLEPQPADQRKKPHIRIREKEEKQKSYSFIDDLTSLMDDDVITKIQEPIQDDNKLRKYRNGTQNKRKLQKHEKQQIILPNKIKQSKIEVESPLKNKKGKEQWVSITKQPSINRKTKQQSPWNSKKGFRATQKARETNRFNEQRKEANQANDHNQFQHKNYAKKSTKGIIFLYKRSTNELMPVKKPPHIEKNENNMPNNQQQQVKQDQKNQNNLTVQPKDTNYQLNQNNPLFNISKNAVEMEQDYIESEPPSLIFDQNEMFQTVSPLSSLHSKSGNAQKKTKQITVLAQLNKIDIKFREDLQEIKQNISRIQSNANNEETVSYLTQQVQQRQTVLNNNHLKSRLLLQGACHLLELNTKDVCSESLAQQNQQKPKRDQYNEQTVVKQQGISYETEIQPSQFENKPKEKELSVYSHQSLFVGSNNQVSPLKDRPSCLIKREQWSLEQDQLLLNFREQPREYRLQMKCLLRYMAIDKIMDRYLQLNIPIDEQSYQILQQMIDNLA